MPYEIRETDNQYCVYKLGDDVSLGCHDTPDLAYAQITAIEINEANKAPNPESKYASIFNTLNPTEKDLWLSTYNDTYDQTQNDDMAYTSAQGAVRRMRIDGMAVHVKSITHDGAIVEGWGMYFTDDTWRDLDGEYFSEDALEALLLDYYKNAPLYMEHGADSNYGVTPIGHRIDVKVYPRGLWVTHQLHSDHPQYEETLRRIRSGEYSYSVDGVGQYARDDGKGKLMWSAIGWALTNRPAEPALGEVKLKTIIKKAVTEAQTARDSKQNLSVQLPLHNKESNPMDVKEEGYEDTQEMKDMEQINALMQAINASLEALDFASAGASALELSSYLENYEGDDVEDATMSEDEEKTEGLPSEVVAGIKSTLAKFNQLMDTTPRNPGGVSKRTGNGKSRTMQPVAQIGKAQKPSFGGFLLDLYQASKSRKDVSYQTGPQGGYLLDHEVSDEIIPYLRSKLVFDALGVQYESLIGLQKLSIPKMTGDLTSYWVGEGNGATASQPQFEMIDLVPKTLMIKIPVPVQYLDRVRMGRGNYETFLRNQATDKMKVDIERAGFFGTNSTTSGNTGPEPLGLLYQTGVTKTALNRVPTLEDVTAMELRILNENIPEGDSWGLAMSPRTWRTFSDLTDTTGRPLIRETWRDNGEKMIVGHKVETTTNIPNNSLGTSDDQSYAFMGAWSNMVVAMGDNIEFQINPWDNMGNLMVNIYAWVYVDIGFHRDEAFEVLTDLDD